MLKAHYSRFLAANPGRLHFAAHSHHLWPDVSRQAVIDCWDEAARLVDRKWDEAIFPRVVPAAQRHVARLIGVSRPEGVAFAPSTHELVVRLLSCLDPRGGLRILTTDGEFISFERQLRRLEEEPEVHVTRVAVEPFESFEERFGAACSAAAHDLVFFSHVFFGSGFGVADLPGIVRSVASPETLVVVDGYHAFAAWPVDLGSIEDRVFYLGGGYKYAQSGEGVCFLHVPAGCRLRPLSTGWYASFGQLAGGPADAVAYSDDAFRFWGATFDATALYRFDAVMAWLQDVGADPAAVLRHVRGLQRRFLTGLEERGVTRLPASSLVTPPDLGRQGHFLAFARPDASRLAEDLREALVDTDVRGDRIRFGFGVYHEAADVDELLDRLAAL